jgi:hypothetical protein
MISSSSFSPSSSRRLTDIRDRFLFEDKLICPVPMATFRTVNFADEASSNAILYSDHLTACAVVIMKNKGLSGKYDNVVTMAHFHPANALSNGQVAETIKKMFEEFKGHGGEVNEDTSIILLGGTILSGEDLMKTTPTGTLIDCLKGNKGHLGYKFTHHESSLGELERHSGSMAFVNKDGTSILKTFFGEMGIVSYTPLTAEKESMPLELLKRIGSNEFYGDMKSLMALRDREIVRPLERASDRDPMMLKMRKAGDVLGEVSIRVEGHSHGK